MNATVLFIDLQQVSMDCGLTQPSAHLRRGTAALAKFTRLPDLPHLATVIPSSNENPSPLAAEILYELPGIECRVRNTFGALADSWIQHYLEENKVRKLIIAGMVTEGAILQTALEARQRGMTVQVVLDVCSGVSMRTENAAIRQIEAAGGTTSSLISIISGFGLDLGSPTGREILGVLQILLTN